jgi:hypothetical protein
MHKSGCGMLNCAGKHYQGGQQQGTPGSWEGDADVIIAWLLLMA